MHHLDKVMSQLIRVEETIRALPVYIRKSGKEVLFPMADELEDMQDEIESLRLRLSKDSEVVEAQCAK